MRIEEALPAAVDEQRGVAAAGRLCQACVRLIGVDAAAISLVHEGVNVATLGASDANARSYDELQFTLGEGPCLDAVANRAPVMIADLADPAGGTRWLAYREALLARQIRGVCAWTELHTLTRAEISQATGMLMAQLDLTAAVALARLRAHAYVSGRGATSVARDIIEHRLSIEAD